MGLKNIPSQFAIDSEEDVRVLVAAYFSDLGFSSNEFSCEDHFIITLGHKTITVKKGESFGRSDILITRLGRPLAIIETKKPGYELKDEDFQQAISYARLLREIAPYAIITNVETTKVFDVISGTEISENAKDSTWAKNDQQLSGINDDLKFFAARKLISINKDTLSSFCQKQVSDSFSDLKSNVVQNKKYIPDVYVKRDDLEIAFSSWLTQGLSIFGLTSQSGYGKTNFMCAKAEESLDDYFVLFYSCGRFIEGITQSIRDDFIWEFSRENDLANIFGRLNDIASNSGKKVIIFLDALDEFPFEMNKLKNELIQICKKIINYDNIKLVISCKSFDWPFFVIDDGQSFTTLAEKISPHTIKSVIPPSKLHAEKVGYNLQEFTEEELNRAITKYSLAYSIKGEFQGEMLRESRNPLMLRFISEIYGMNKQELPNSITSLELYNLYFDRKISKLKYCGIAEKILYTISEIIFKVTSRSISKDHLLASLPWDDSYEATFSGLLRLGILTCRENNFDKELGFKFHKFFLYICSFKFWKLQQLPCDGRVEKILLLLDSQLGVEVVEFFLPQYNKISQMKP